MFRKVNSNKNKIAKHTDESVLEDNFINNLNDDINNITPVSISKTIQQIKSEIDKKYKNPLYNRGVQMKAMEKEEKVSMPLKKEETRQSSIKKIFVSESQLKEAKNPEEKQKLLGVKREDVERIKEDKKKGLLDMQKELFSLPDYLKTQPPKTKNDHMDNLLRLSTAGLIEVPLPLEQKLKNIEESEVMKKQNIDNKMIEELDFLKVLKKNGPSYAKGYKNDISHKKLMKLNNVFENVFVGANSKRKKLFKEKVIMENRLMEE